MQRGSAAGIMKSIPFNAFTGIIWRGDDFLVIEKLEVLLKALNFISFSIVTSKGDIEFFKALSCSVLFKLDSSIVGVVSVDLAVHTGKFSFLHETNA